MRNMPLGHAGGSWGPVPGWRFLGVAGQGFSARTHPTVPAREQVRRGGSRGLTQSRPSGTSMGIGMGQDVGPWVGVWIRPGEGNYRTGERTVNDTKLEI